VSEHTDCVLKLSNVKRMDIWTVVRTILEKSPRVKAKELILKIKRKTGLSRSTIYEHLLSFVLRGKLCREKGWYWLPKRTRKSSRATLGHSRQLSLGLEAILAEDWTLYRYQEPSKERARWKDKIEREGNKLKKFAIEHLRSSYPDIYEKMKRWRELKAKAKKMLLDEGNPEDVTEGVINFVSFVGIFPRISEECQEVLDQRIEVYQALTSDIELVNLKIEAGKPLRGTCRLCHE